jgi:hypothetical protein
LAYNVNNNALELLAWGFSTDGMLGIWGSEHAASYDSPRGLIKRLSRVPSRLPSTIQTQSQEPGNEERELTMQA